MAGSNPRIVVAGAGVAGLETLLALHAYCDGAELTLVAPDDEFVYRPIAVKDLAVGRTRRVPLTAAASAASATFVPAMIAAVDPAAHAITTSADDRIAYDALVLAVGAEPMPAVERALTWDDRSESELLGGLLRDIEEGYSRSVAVVIPSGPGWPLRGYELALLIKLEADGMSAEVATTLVVPDPPPLARLGEQAVDAIATELDRAGVRVTTATHVERDMTGRPALVLQPSRERLEVDRVLALPVLRGRAVPGVPAGPDGFFDVDEHCRVRGSEDIWAAGDCTSFPMKSGRVAAEQADAAALSVAAAAGAPVEPQPFDPGLGRDLAGLPAGRHLEAWLALDDPGLAMHLPASGLAVLTYLQRDLAAGWRGYG